MCPREKSPSAAVNPRRLPAVRKNWTTRALLQWSAVYLREHGSRSPRLDAELLLAEILGCTRLDLYLDIERPLNPAELAQFKELLKRRGRHEPIAYIRGHTEFWSMRLSVSPAVLIPRPETEVLVETVLQLLDTDKPWKFLDAGTGSGCIALALAREFPASSVTALDASATALQVAQKNAADLKLAGRIRFLQSNWFARLEDGATFDCLCSNPPYLAPAERTQLAPDVADFEPGDALFGVPRGLRALDHLLRRAPAHLNAGGWVVLEFAPAQRQRLVEISSKIGYGDIACYKDYARHNRVLAARWPG